MNPRISGKEIRKQKAVNFIIQGSTLAMAGIVVRIIGMLYRMPLSGIIGKQGNGHCTSVLSMYSILFILSSYNIPMAVSKMISVRLARGGHRNCSRVLKTTLIYATAVGDTAAVALWFGANLFAQLIKTLFNQYTLRTPASTIWIMAYLGVLRGYFQGTGTMVPTAVSQTLGQIVNAVVSTVVARVLFGVGVSTNAAQGVKDYFYVLGVAGGTIGIGAGMFTVFLFFICLTTSKGRERRQMAREDVSGRTGSYRRISYALTITVLSIVISSDTYNCSSVVDNYLFGQGMDKLGYTEDSIVTYQNMLGQYQLFFSIPATVSNALSSFLIPSLTRAVANRSKKEKLEWIATSIRFSLLIAIPAAVGITVLVKPACNLLFISENNTMLIRLSMTGSLAVVFYSLSTVTSAVFQGSNHMDVPIHHAAIALITHVTVLEVSLMVPKTGAYSIVFANIIFAPVMCLLSGHAITRLVRYRQGYRGTLIPPTVRAGFMGVAAYRVYRGIYALSPDQLMRGRMGMAIVVFPSVAVAILVYTVLLVRLRAVEKEELKGMPRGRRLVHLLNRFRLLG